MSKEVDTVFNKQQGENENLYEKLSSFISDLQEIADNKVLSKDEVDKYRAVGCDIISQMRDQNEHIYGKLLTVFSDIRNKQI